MNSKISLVLFLSFTIMCSFSFGQNYVKIKGKIENNKASKINLKMYGVEDDKPVQANIDAAGNFSMKVPFKKVGFYQLIFGEDKYIILVLEGEEDLEISVDAGDIYPSCKITGNGEKNSSLIYQTYRDLNLFSEKLDSIEKKYEAVYEDNEIAAKELETEYEKIQKNQKTFIEDFILKNSSSLACLFFIEQLDIDKDYDIYAKLANSLIEKYAKNPFVVALDKKVKKAGLLKEGSLAPEIVSHNPDDEETKLSDLRGKTVLIDFWASWCVPCRKESPNMRRYYEVYKEKGLEIFSVSLDNDKKRWVDAIISDNLNWTHVSDLRMWQSKAGKDYGVRAIPFTVLIDAEGKVIAKELRGGALEQKLEDIFGE